MTLPVCLLWSGVFALVCTRASADPIRLSDRNPHYFAFGGKTTALVTSGEHYGAVLYEGFDYPKYLAALAADGLNYTRLFGGSYVEAPAVSFGILRNDLAPGAGQLLEPWARSRTGGYAGGGNRFDLSAWDPRYFERLRGFLAEAQRRGIAVEITLFSSVYDEAQWRVNVFNEANNVNDTGQMDYKKLHTLENGKVLRYQESYTRKLVREANGFDNVIFEIQNEPWSDRPVLTSVVNPYLFPPARDQYPNSIDLADELSTQWQARVAGWITSEEEKLPKKHLIAQNYSNFGYPVNRLAPGVSVVNFHYANPESVLWNYGLGKAIACDETGFLGQGDEKYLRQAWNFLLSGGGLFDGLDYSFSVGHEDGSDTEKNGPGGGSAALRRELGILSRFLKGLPLDAVAPDLRVVKHAAVYVHALSQAGREYGMYFDGKGPADAVLDLPAGEYRGEWMDVESGKTVRKESFRHAGGEKDVTTPAAPLGVALRLSRTTPH